MSFRALHARPGGFVMPNCWDAGSAVLLAEAGFEALATTSAGIAFSMGRPDYGVGPQLAVSRQAMFERVREITEVVGVPVNGDLEAGYGDSPEAVAETIRLARDAGLAGGNIEDRIPGADGLYDETLAVERIAAAREAAGPDFVLTGRCDAFAVGQGMAEAVRRSNLYRAAGADCLYTPGASDRALIARLVAEIDGPLNVVMGLGNADNTTGDLLAAGVQRISLGGSIARSALGFLRRCAEELKSTGAITFAEGQIPQGELNSLFVRARS
jgi:2-methylisocitrate lyase-like PEP mutase family enzyme